MTMRRDGWKFWRDEAKIPLLSPGQRVKGWTKYLGSILGLYIMYLIAGGLATNVIPNLIALGVVSAVISSVLFAVDLWDGGQKAGLKMKEEIERLSTKPKLEISESYWDRHINNFAHLTIHNNSESAAGICWAIIETVEPDLKINDLIGQRLKIGKEPLGTNEQSLGPDGEMCIDVLRVQDGFTHFCTTINKDQKFPTRDCDITIKACSAEAKPITGKFAFRPHSENKADVFTRIDDAQ